MQFFAFNIDWMVSASTPSKIVSEGLDSLLKTVGITSEMKLELFTMGRNSIMMRIENIGDIFDSELNFSLINVSELSNGLFKLMNSDDIKFAVEIQEMTLTGNQLYQTMAQNKIKWATIDD